MMKEGGEEEKGENSWKKEPSSSALVFAHNRYYSIQEFDTIVESIENPLFVFERGSGSDGNRARGRGE